MSRQIVASKGRAGEFNRVVGSWRRRLGLASRRVLESSSRRVIELLSCGIELSIIKPSSRGVDGSSRRATTLPSHGTSKLDRRAVGSRACRLDSSTARLGDSMPQLSDSLDDSATCRTESPTPRASRICPPGLVACDEVAPAPLESRPQQPCPCLVPCIVSDDVAHLSK